MGHCHIICRLVFKFPFFTTGSDGGRDERGVREPGAAGDRAAEAAGDADGRRAGARQERGRVILRRVLQPPGGEPQARGRRPDAWRAGMIINFLKFILI